MSLFISFEGPEGSGKSTQAQQLASHLEEAGRSVLLTREPGGSPLGEQIRDLLLDPEHDPVDPWAELFLYLAARSQHVARTIQPALSRGSVVITDRFADASVAYQGAARQLGEQTVRDLNELATRGLTPDLTFILDVETREGLRQARRTSNDAGPRSGDRIEEETTDFHERVRDAYRRLARREPERCVYLARNGTIEEIQDQIRERVREHENRS